MPCCILCFILVLKNDFYTRDLFHNFLFHLHCLEKSSHTRTIGLPRQLRQVERQLGLDSNIMVIDNNNLVFSIVNSTNVRFDREEGVCGGCATVEHVCIEA